MIRYGTPAGSALRTLSFLLLITSAVLADVAVLRDGRKVAGKVSDRGTHYEVSTEFGPRTFLKEEVERIISNPKESLGESENLYEEAKRQWKQVKDINSSSERNAALKDAIAKLKTARDAIVLTRELFPEPKYADLDQKLVLVMQLTRMFRAEVTHDATHERENPRETLAGRQTPVFLQPLPTELGGAFATLADPARRSQEDQRVAARETFRFQRAKFPAIYDLSTAAMLFLSRSDKDWNVRGDVQNALQQYFAKPWLTGALQLTPSDNQKAAQYLAEQMNLLRKNDPAVSVDALALFGVGHLSQAPIGQETDRIARILGLVVQNGIAGTPEGHVVRELNGWISTGDFDLAVLSWVKEPQLRSVDTPTVRFVWSSALLRLVQQKKCGFERPIAALGTVQSSDPAVRDHLSALVRSIKAVAVCNVCAGEGKLRCTNCHGKTETRIVCKDCGGTAKKKQSSGFLLDNCPRCKSTGVTTVIRCEKCKGGWNDCRQCDKKPHAPPTLEDICTMSPCEECESRGYVFRGILWACKSCLGAGQKFIPRTDPGKTLVAFKS